MGAIRDSDHDACAQASLVRHGVAIREIKDLAVVSRLCLSSAEVRNRYMAMQRTQNQYCDFQQGNHYDYTRRNHVLYRFNQGVGAEAEHPTEVRSPKNRVGPLHLLLWLEEARRAMLKAVRGVI